MIEYFEEIIVPYIDSQREVWSAEQAAQVIMDNFKGQITSTIYSEATTFTYASPPNTTDMLQPMDISVNKLEKNFLKQKFVEWFSNKVMKQLDGVTDIESVEIKLVDMCMAVIKKLTSHLTVAQVNLM